MIGATRFEPPSLGERAPSPRRPRTGSAKPGRRGLPPPLSPKGSPANGSPAVSRGASPFPATPQGISPARSRPDTAGPEATPDPTPDPFGRDGPKRVSRSANPNLTRRPLSPPDRRLVRGLGLGLTAPSA